MSFDPDKIRKVIDLTNTMQDSEGNIWFKTASGDWISAREVEENIPEESKEKLSAIIKRFKEL